MELVKLAVTYGLTLSVFVALDYLWVGVLMRRVYERALGHLFAQRFNKAALVAFYLIFVLGLCFFAISPGFIKGSYLAAGILGGLFGFFTYATYDLTNRGTLKGWSWSITLIDMLWGIVMPGIVAMAGLLIARALI